MSQRSKKVDAQVYLERFTLVDKKSMFRSSEPDQYYLQIMIETGNSRVIAREFIFTSKQQQTDHYKQLRRTFGMEAK